MSLVLSILFDLTHLHLTSNPVTVLSLCMYLAIELNVCFQKQALLPANIHYKHLSLSLLFCLRVIWSFEMSYFLLQDSLKFTSQPRLAWNSKQFSWLSLSVAGVTGVSHHAQLKTSVLVPQRLRSGAWREGAVVKGILLWQRTSSYCFISSARGLMPLTSWTPALMCTYPDTDTNRHTI